MSTYYSQDGYTIVRKHYMFLLFYITKFIFILVLAFFILFVSLNFETELGLDFSLYIFFPLVFFLYNYAFAKLIIGFINHYNYLFIIKGDQVFIIKCSLIMRDDIEVIDSFKIIKIDSFSRGLFSNLFGYGTLIIELQSRETRSFRFIPNPYRLIKILEEQRNFILQDRKKKYVTIHPHPNDHNNETKPIKVNMKDKIRGILNS